MASKSNNAPQLVVIEGKDKGKVIPLQHGTTIIGRSKGEFLVQDARVSRSHVAIHFDEKRQRLSFTDLKSLNGTLINNETQDSGILKDGDQLKIGDTVFDCQLGEVKERAKGDEPEASIPDFGDVDLPFDSADTREQRRPKKRRSSLRQQYLSFSPRTRRIGLYLSLIGLLALYGILNQGPSRSELERSIAEAAQLKDNGKFNEALEKLRNDESFWPEDLHSGFLLWGDIFAEMGHHDKAIASYLKVRSREGITPMVHIKLLRAYLHSGLMEEAQGELRSLDLAVKKSVQDLVGTSKEENRPVTDVLTEKPEIRTLLVETGKLFVEFEQLAWSQDKAKLLTKGLQTQIAPDSPVGFILEAQMLARENQVAEAKKLLEEAKKRSNDAWSIGHIAHLLFNLSDYEGATIALAEWLSLTPKSEQANFLQNKIFAFRALDKAQRLETSGNTDKDRIKRLMEESIRYLEAADSFNTRDSWVIENIAHAKLKLLDYSGAAAIVNRWVKLYPRSTKALLIMSYLKLNDRAPDQALPYINRILEISKQVPQEPFFAEAMYLKSQVLVFKDEKDEAARLAKQACDLGYADACKSPLLQGDRSPTKRRP